MPRAKLKIDIPSMNALLEWFTANDPRNQMRWRLSILHGWNDEDSTYILTESVNSAFGSYQRLRLAPEFGEELRYFYTNDEYENPKGALKATGLFKRWDDDHGTSFLAAARLIEKGQAAREDRAAQLRTLRDIQMNAEFLALSLDRDLPPGTVTPELRSRLQEAARAVWEDIKDALPRLEKEWGIRD